MVESYTTTIHRLNRKYPIQWRSPEERVKCFNALVTLMHRGIQTTEVSQVTMEVIMDRPVYSHELANPDKLLLELCRKWNLP